MLRGEEIIPAKLSLDDAISISLGVNVSLKSAVQAQKASETRLHVTQLNTSYSMGSTVNLERSPTSSTFSNLVYSDLNYENLIGTTATVRLSPLGVGSSFGSVGLLLKQPLMQGRGRLSQKGYDVLNARSDVTVREYDLFQARQDTILGVIEAYYGAVLSQERVTVAEQALSISKEVADGSRKREAAGLMTGLQVTRADIQVARTNDDLNLARQSSRGSLDRLMLAIGAGMGETPELTDPLPETVPDLPPLEEAIKAAVVKRTELKALDVRIANQQRDLDMRKDAFRPALNAVARFDSTNPDTGLISGSIFDMGSTVLGVELSLPLDKRALQANKDIAEKDLQILRDRQDYQTDQITEEVRRAYRAVESAKISLEIYTQNLTTAQDGLHYAERLVEEGEGSNRDVLDAQQALSEVQVGLLSAKTELYLASMRLKQAMGEDLTTMVSK